MRGLGCGGRSELWVCGRGSGGNFRGDLFSARRTFVALRRVRDSELMRIVAQTMPLGVMVILVTFTVSGVKFGVLASWLPALGGIVATALVHWRWANALVSIVVGVGAFWVLGQVLA